MLKNKMIIGIDDDVWRKFTSKCRYDGIKVSDRITDLIKEKQI
jgi:macrodomain Ter protein organizer (MatP/YcbG family)